MWSSSGKDVSCQHLPEGDPCEVHEPVPARSEQHAEVMKSALENERNGVIRARLTVVKSKQAVLSMV